MPGLSGPPVSEIAVWGHGGEAPEEHIESLLASESLIDDLLCLALAGAVTPKLQVVALAAAMSQAAIEGGVSEGYVREIFEARLAGAREPDPRGENPN